MGSVCSTNAAEQDKLFGPNQQKIDEKHEKVQLTTESDCEEEKSLRHTELPTDGTPWTKNNAQERSAPEEPLSVEQDNDDYNQEENVHEEEENPQCVQLNDDEDESQHEVTMAEQQIDNQSQADDVDEESEQEDGQDEEDGIHEEDETDKLHTWSAFETDCIQAHNEYRALHGAPPLVLSRDLCAIAQQHADELTKTDKFEHSSDRSRAFKEGTAGENLAISTSSAEGAGRIAAGIDGIRQWYNEINKYNFDKDHFITETGHFTAIVWESSKELGIAVASCNVKGWDKHVIVANYYPGGNVEGMFEGNVKAPINKFG